MRALHAGRFRVRDLRRVPFRGLTKVCEDQSIVLTEENVVRLYISMHDVSAMSVLDSFK